MWLEKSWGPTTTVTRESDYEDGDKEVLVFECSTLFLDPVAPKC